MMTVEQRFESRVDRSGGPHVCHPWTGNVGQWGHPTMHYSKTKSMSVRRIAWKIAHGDVPSERRWVTTTCGNHLCLNPKHLAIRAAKDDVSRFWEKVDKRGPEECWPWVGYIDRTGYGRFSPLGGTRTRQAHRVAWEMANDKPIPLDVPVELVVMHSCDNPRCVNPAHLSLGTDADNQADMDRKGRRSCGERHRLATQAAREKGWATQRALRERRAAEPNEPDQETK